MRHASKESSSEVRVWDLPTRVFHWLLALSFALAYTTAESKRLALLHVTMGYTVGGLVCFRLLWGWVGTRHARFSDFVRGPAAWLRYLRSLFGRQPEHHLGHNPIGGAVIMALLTLGALLALTGWLQLYSSWGDAAEELHEGLANAMLTLVGIHVLGVLVSSWLHRERLVTAMVTGYKRRHPVASTQPGVRMRAPIGVLLLAIVLAYWSSQWVDRPRLSAELQARMERLDSGQGDDDAQSGQTGKHRQGLKDDD